MTNTVAVNQVALTLRAKEALDSWSDHEREGYSLRIRTAETLLEEGFSPDCFVSPKNGGALVSEAWDYLVSRALFIIDGDFAVALQNTPAKSLAEWQKTKKRDNRQKAGSVIRDLKKVFMTRWTALHGEPETVETETETEGKETEKVNVGKADFSDKAVALAFFKELEGRLMDVQTEQYPVEQVIDLICEIQGVISNSKAKAKRK